MKKVLQQWAENLTQDQLKEVTIDLMLKLVESGEIAFYEDTEYPYWTKTDECIMDVALICDNE